MLGHIFVAIMIQACVATVFRNWTAGAAAASGWAISREISQAEYRWIERYGDGLRVNMSWWGGLDPGVWQRIDPWLDWILPCAATIAIAIAMQARNTKILQSK